MVNVIDYDRVRVTRRRLGTKEVFPDPLPDPYKTAEEMEKHCCVPTPKVQCYERYIGPIYPDMEEAMKNAGITPRTDGVYDGTGTKDGRLTRIAWRPRRNPCGKVIERVKMDPKNCCDEVEPIVFDWDSSVEVLEPGTSGFVSFTGGKLPALVKIRGNGFSFDGYSARQAWTYSRTFRVYAHEMACGFASITIDDGCTVEQGGVRASLGEWYRYVYKQGGYSDCPDIFPGASGFISDSTVLTGERGGYRFQQRFAVMQCSSSTGYWARKTYAESLAMCEWTSDISNCSITYFPDRYTGSCFDSFVACTECGECTYSSQVYANYCCAHPGFYSKNEYVSNSVTPYWGWARWVDIAYTYGYKWIC
jgi:hypothetical protein